MTNYQMQVLGQDGARVVDFTNNTGAFVEVVLEIDGKLVKGYCYPPYHHKPIRRMRTGHALPFSETGTVRAYVYQGRGEYKNNEDPDVPTFIRFRINQNSNLSTDDMIQRRLRHKVTFRRTSTKPEILEIPY